MFFEGLFVDAIDEIDALDEIRNVLVTSQLSPPPHALWASLKRITSEALALPLFRVFRCRRRIVAKVLSIGFVVRM